MSSSTLQRPAEKTVQLGNLKLRTAKKISIVNILFALIVTIIAVVWILPLVWMAITAFKPRGEIFSFPPRWIPSRFSLENFDKLFSDWPYFHWLVRSFLVAATATVGTLLVSTLAAYAFSRFSWKGRDIVFLFFLVFMLLPWQINIIPLFFLMTKLGFLNTIQGVALPIIAMPIGLFLLRQFFINIPKDLEDAARIDGYSSFGILLNVIIPVSKPVFAALTVFIFTWSWNEFFWSAVCLQRKNMLTIPVGLRILQGAYDIDYGLFMAASFAAVVPALLIFLFFRNFVIRGFTMIGGMKG